MSKAATKRQLEPLRLDFRSEQQVVVVPEDEDRFVTTSAKAARACSFTESLEEWQRNFKQFLTRLHQWSRKHGDLVARTYLAFSHDGLKIFVLTKGLEYQFDFDDTVSRLELELDEQYPHWPTDVMVLPGTQLEALTSFFTPSESLQVYGH